MSTKESPLTTFGFGMDNYNDTLMEQLADNGDGFYAYIDDIDEAQRLFVDEIHQHIANHCNGCKGSGGFQS